MPTHSDPWGLVLNEAMACGLAVVSSDVAGAALDLIRNGENGYIFKKGDIHGLAVYLKNILSDEYKLAEMGEKIRGDYSGLFSLKVRSGAYSGNKRSISMNEAVKKHWESETCGVRYGASEDRGEWFREIEHARYLSEPQILEFAEFKKFRAKRVLEIGVGAGTDFKNWVKNGAQATGIDLTSRGIELTKERLSLEGISPNRFNLCG